MKVLRDPALSSRLLILLELRRRPVGTLAPLAKAVELTPQAVSQYMKKLERDGFVVRQDGIYRATPAGVDFMQNQFQELKHFTDRAVRDLITVDSCVAIAGWPTKKGDKVGLFMSDGRLLAFTNRKSPSWGIAQADAAPQRDVLVKDLHGIVEIPDASLTILETPSSSEGGSAAIDVAWLRQFVKDNESLWRAAIDELGEGVLKESNRNWDYEFVPFEGAVAAVSRGVSPLYVGGPEAVARLLASIEAAKAEGRLKGFSYQVIRAKRVPRREAKARRTTIP